MLTGTRRYFILRIISNKPYVDEIKFFLKKIYRLKTILKNRPFYTFFFVPFLLIPVFDTLVLVTMTFYSDDLATVTCWNFELNVVQTLVTRRFKRFKRGKYVFLYRLEFYQKKKKKLYSLSINMSIDQRNCLPEKPSVLARSGVSFEGCADTLAGPPSLCRTTSFYDSSLREFSVVRSKSVQRMAYSILEFVNLSR